MAELSEEEDKLLARLLLNTDLVSEQNVEMVRQLKESFRQKGIKVSIVDLLIQSGFLSRSDLNSLRTMAKEETEEGESIMPPRFEHPFLTQQDLAEQARDEGVISEETHQKVEEIQDLFDENGVNKSKGEILVEQGFVQPEDLDFEEETSEEEGMFDISAEQQEDLTSATQESDPDESSFEKVSIITELDRYVLEELVDRGRLQRSQIPTLVQKAQEKNQETSGSSPVQDVLRDQGILHPTTESEVISAAMDRQDEAQRWRNQFSNVGPLTVTIVLVILVISLLVFLYGSGEEGSTSNGAAKQTGGKGVGTIEEETADEQVPEKSDQQRQKEEKEEKKEPLLTFQANLSGPLSGNDCDCTVLFDGASVSTVSGTIEKGGTFQVKLFRDYGTYAPGGYLLDCSILETPGASLLSFPSQFRNALEEYGPPNNKQFEAFLNEEQWDFVTFAGLRSQRSNINDTRTEFAEDLRDKLQDILDLWDQVETHLSEEDPTNRQLLQASKLNQACNKLRKKLNAKAEYNSFYYPDVRRVVRKQLRELPRVIGRVMIKQRREKGIDVPDEFRQFAGSGTGGGMKAIQSIADSIREQKDRLPAEDESIDELFSFKPFVEKELAKLAEIVRVLSLLRNNEEVRQQAIERRQDMAKYALVSFYKYALVQIELRSVLLNNTSKLNIYEESTGEQIDELSNRVQTYLLLVTNDLADRYSLDLPSGISDVEESIESVRQEIFDRFGLVGIEVLDEGAGQ